ncbi:MAG TPA: MIP/aquaporin family protein [Ktedonobacterales bacterium]|nr:MIP/aquaporin family protein [Ktedonobacterales bacterium]
MGYQGYQPSLVERFLAELVGAFMLVFVGAGAATVTALALHSAKATPTMADLLLIALAHGLVLFVIVLVFGKISGAHVNPAVTLALASIGRFPWEEVFAYVLGQFIGAVLGALAILAVYGKLAATVGELGRPSLATNTSIVQGIVIEALGAFILVLAVVATAIDSRAPAGWAGLAIGMALASAILLLGPATGAAVNPARAFGPDLVSVLFGAPAVDWTAYIVCYLIGPIIGGAAAAWLYAYIARLPRTATTATTPAARSARRR